MTTYTNLEVATYNAILDISEDDIGASLSDLIEETGMKAKVLRGVVSSLIQKGKLSTYDCSEDITVYVARHGFLFYSWGGESLTDEEYKLFTKLAA